MPIVTIQWAEGRTVEMKRQVTKKITDAIVEVTGADPNRVYVFIHDVPDTNVGNKGKLRIDGWN